jgi:flagellar basal-body rod protein FlgG
VPITAEKALVQGRARGASIDRNTTPHRPMLDGLLTAAAGLSAQQTQLDAVANDMANVNTDGYKSERVAFDDLLYNKVNMAGTETTAGAGSSAKIIGRSQTQGALKETGSPLDLAIDGPGYFEVTRANGQVALTRDGSFSLDATGTIVDAEGNRLSPSIKLPAGVSPSEVSIDATGNVSIGSKQIGQVKVLDVTAPGQMLSLGGSLFAPTPESGEPQPAAGTRIVQGALEQSNVDLGSEMTSLVTTERAFQMDSEAIQNDSQMLSIANQLRPA